MKQSIQCLQLLFFLPLIVASNLNGQNPGANQVVRDAKGEIAFFKASPNSAQRLMSNGNQYLKSIHNAPTDTEFRLIRKSTDENSETHQVYQQYFKAIPIEGGYFLVHGKGDLVLTVRKPFP